VLVIGGGSVAMDAAGSALRMKSEVVIVAVEERASMPAEEEEIEEALDEGARLIDGAMVKTVADAAGAFRLGCCRARLDPDAPPGMIRPLAIANSDFALEADTVILAVGQDPELAGWNASLALGRNMVAIDGAYMSSRAGVFAAGDCASAERFVSSAIGDGKRAAQSIARYLGLASAEDDQAAARPKEVAFAEVNTFYFPNADRVERAKVAPAERSADFRQVRVGFAPEQARSQAERCFSCGFCTRCDNCFYFCPDMAIVKDASSPLHYRVLERYCKGCASCVTECPRGAIGMREEAK
ncbi:MAG: FAD-dependent oxidoreductase, partial [Betaproteobacteria bacterium]|nr:FAD-dependent oxidoreductase [Betaproteobacteria bacterium]